MRTDQMSDHQTPSHFSAIVFCVGAMLCFHHAAAAESPLLRCEVSYAGSTHTLDTQISEQPYLATMHDIGGRFSFKAVMIGTRKKIDYIKLYAYLQGRELDTPIHQATYQKPILVGKRMKALTPFNHLYAGEVEREMQYQCFLGWHQK